MDPENKLIYKYTVCIRCITYNHEKYIENAIIGFISQKTSFPFIAIIIDDCSTDTTPCIIKKYEQLYPDIIKGVYLKENYYSQHKSKQPFFEEWEKQSKYIAFCEGDDYWTDYSKLQKQVEYMDKNPDCGMCSTDFSICDEDFNLITKSCYLNGYPRSSNFNEHLMTAGYIAPMTWLYKSTLIPIMQNPQHFIDGSFAVALELYKNSRIDYLPTDTAMHITHPGSATRQINPHNNFIYKWDVFKEQLFYARKYGSPQQISQLKFDNYLTLLPKAITLGEEDFINEANQYFNSIGINLDYYIKFCINMSKTINDALLSRKSYSYRLGKFLITPLKWIKSINLFK